MDIIRNLGELALGSRLRRMSNTLMNETLAIYRYHQFDFEPRWFPTFYYLNEIYPQAVGVTDIAKVTRVSHPLINRFVTELKKAGYVEEVADEHDRRKRLIKLSYSGNELGQLLTPIWNEMELSIRDVICSVEPAMMKLLESLEDRFEEKGFLDTYMSRNKTRRYRAIEIRVNDPKFFEEFRKINLEWLEEYFGVEELDLKILDNPRKLIDEGGYIFSAILNDEVLGTCALMNLGDGAMELGKMGVYKKARGMQIGRKLLDVAIDKSREIGAKIIFLESNNRLKKALDLYRRAGFEFTAKSHTGESHYQRANVFMRLDLDENS